MTITSGMPACRRQTRYRGNDYHVRHPGIPAPDHIQRDGFHVQHAVRHAGMPAPDKIQRAQRKQSSMPARHRRGEYGIREKRKVALKKAIRPAGRQAVPTDERRNGRGHRHDGMSAKEKEIFDVEKGDPAGRQAGRFRR